MSFYLFRRYFLSARSGALIKLVSWICMAGMTVSVAALILITSVMGGFGKAIKIRLLSKSTHLALKFQENPFLHEKTTYKRRSDSLFSSKEEPDFLFSSLTKEQKAGIKEVLLFEKQDLILKTSKGFKGVSAIGYTEKQWQENFSKFSNNIEVWTENSTLSPILKNPAKEVVLSYELFLEMNSSEEKELFFIPLTGLLLPPGIPPPIKRMQIKGALQEPSQGEKAFYIHYKKGNLDFGDFSKLSYGAEIKLYDPEQVSLYKKLFQKYKPQSWKERNSTLFFALKLEKFIMVLLLILALVISCLGISSAMLLLMTQKGKDIAILRAMGMSKKTTIKTFTKIGLYLSLIALCAGAFIGLGGTLFLKYNDSINFLGENYRDRTLPAIFVPLQYLAILSSSFFISWISCYLPTKFLSYIKPAELLKITRF